MKKPAILFRKKVYVASPRHADAIVIAFSKFTEQQRFRVYDRISESKEEIVFGFACDDGTDFEESDYQSARKHMYGFD